MYIFYLFGRQVEVYYTYFFEGMGKLFYFLLYLGGVVMSSLYAYERNKDNIHYNALGASGAVSSVLFASIVMDPGRMIGFFFIPMPGWMAGIVYLLYSWYMDRRAADHVAHDAHFWGAVFGVVFTIILRPAFAVEFIGKIIP
jgi:membrane associated rhomboid family serine protease